MDGISSSMWVGSGAFASAQSVLPTQPSRPIVIPPSVANNETTRPGASNNSSQTNASASAQPSQTSSPQSSSQSAPQNDAANQAQQQRQQEQQVQQVIAQLKSRDQEVRTHEQAHLAAAGQYATGGIKYQYQTGPDGQKYAVGGSVGIDTAPVAGDPEATIQKARVVQQAALAPAQPSSQDMRVAAQASQMMMQAQAELRTQQIEGQDEVSGETAESNPEQSMDSQGEAQRINPARNDFEVRMSLQQTAANNDPYMIQSAG